MKEEIDFSQVDDKAWEAVADGRLFIDEYGCFLSPEEMFLGYQPGIED
jgi:hypothetical protein